MSVDPTISIIIPVYNVEPYIDECICSVLEQQGDTPLELILVDDCGEDNSMDIVRERVSNLPPHLTATILQHKKNRGLSAARNTGTAAARGEYILYLDSDDALLPTAISTLLQEAQKSGADITIGGLTLTSPDDRDFFVTKQGEWKGVNVYKLSSPTPSNLWRGTSLSNENFCCEQVSIFGRGFYMKTNCGSHR